MKHCLSSKMLDLNDCMATRKDTAKHARGVSVLKTCHAIGVSSIAVHKHSPNPELLNFKAGVLKVV